MKKLLTAFLILLISHGWCAAQRITYDDNRVTVGVLVQPPFIIKNTDGNYAGLSNDLWEDLARELKINFEYREYYDSWTLLRGLSYNEIDISINPWEVNSSRMATFDVSQPFFISSLGVAATKTGGSKLENYFRNILSVGFLEVVLLLLLVLSIIGILVWTAEHRYNGEQFAKGKTGVFDGIWWAAATMTTVGYGDKTPKTPVGRIIGLLWMFTSMIIISSFTATITSTLTINTLESNIKTLDDLKQIRRVGTVSGASHEYLETHEITPYLDFETSLEGLIALEEGKIDVFVYDKPIMRYLIDKNNLDSKVMIMPITLNKQYRSFLMPKESRLFGRVNPELVDLVNVATWQETLKSYNLHEEAD